MDYDPRWPERFQELRAGYSGALTRADVPYVAIEHVGSTSVPGLAAKPVIDLDIVVEEVEVQAASDVLASMGFRPLGELGIAQRWAFEEPERLIGTATYVIVNDSLSLRNHLAFRDILRRDSALRDEYAAVKRAGAATARDIFEYGRYKNAVVQRILALAGISEEDLSTINNAQVPTADEVPRRWLQASDATG